MLVFGIDDETRTHKPIADMQKEIEFITACIKDRVSPIPEFILEPDVTENNEEVLVLKIMGGLNTPYYLIENSTKITFIRAGSSSVQADTPILHELILKGTNRTWDTLKSEHKAKDFSFTLLESVYFNKTGNHLEPRDYLSFGLITQDGFLTNTGALFTDVSPFRQARIFCTRWNGLSKAPSSVDAIDDKEFSGNILQLLTDSESFIKLHNQKIWYKTAASRIEKENFPERAIHEAMVNALVHRDYGVLGSEIHIDIFDDRIEIQNPGGMYDGVPVQNQDLENIISTRRNPVIADFMNRMDFMERRGSGFRKILAAVKFAPNYREENLPVFKSTPFSFTAIIKNLNFDVKTNIENEVENKDIEKNGLKSHKWPDANEGLNDPVNDPVKIILELIKQNPNATYAYLAAKINKSEATVKRTIVKLKEAKLIKRVGADKNGSWEIL